MQDQDIAMKNLDLNKFEGMWHEIVKTKSPLSATDEYSVYKYTLQPDETIKLEIFQQKSGKEEKIDTIATFDSNLPSVWKIKYQQSFLSSLYLDAIIIDTDYDNYAILYAKIYLWFFTKEMAWIMSRKKKLPAKTIKKLLKKLEKTTNIKKESMVFNLCK